MDERRRCGILRLCRVSQGWEYLGRTSCSASRQRTRLCRQSVLYEANKGKRYDAFYGRSWLLYHYLTFSAERQGQMTQYQVAVLNGTPPIEAGEQVFGDLDQLEKELNAYARQKMYTFDLAPERLTVGDIEIRKLSKGEANVMPLVMRSQRGVTDEQAAELVLEVREVAAAFPDDAAVLAALAEAEYDAGNDDAAIAAADKAIALNPKLTNPYVQKGYALFRKAADADDQDAAYELAVRPFSQLNAIENDHPLPLIYYYRSYAERGIEPSENAKAAIEYAAQLAPFDKGLWFQVAMLQMREGRIGLARRSLQPLAFDPHGGSLADRAKSLMSALAQVEEGTKVGGSGLVQTRPPANVEAAPSPEADTLEEG